MLLKVFFPDRDSAVAEGLPIKCIPKVLPAEPDFFTQTSRLPILNFYGVAKSAKFCLNCRSTRLSRLRFEMEKSEINNAVRADDHKFRTIRPTHP